MNAPFIDLSVHHRPKGLSDRVAYGFTKVLRWTADTFFAERYGHRAVVLETVGMIRARERGARTTGSPGARRREPRGFVVGLIVIAGIALP